jgi:hypothetical protein
MESSNSDTSLTAERLDRLCPLLQVHDGRLYVNGVAREEPFIYQKPAYTLGKLVVPPGDVSLCSPAANAGFCAMQGHVSHWCLDVEWSACWRPCIVTCRPNP